MKNLENGEAPSTREIAAEFGIPQQNALFMLKDAVECGLLVRVGASEESEVKSIENGRIRCADALHE